MPRLLRTLAVSTLMCLAAATASAQAKSPIEKRWSSPPAGYTVAVLEPLGGRALLPSGWRLLTSRDDTTWFWTLIPATARPQGGEPDAMMSIQVQPRLSASEKMTPSQWVRKAFADKKASSLRVLRECGPSQVGIFVRHCLEVEERSPQGRVYHTVLSVFTADETDLLALTIQRSLVDQWAQYAPGFQAMSGVELIDMDRFAGPARGGRR